MHFCFFKRFKEPRAFHDKVNAERAPRQLRRVFFLQKERFVFTDHKIFFSSLIRYLHLHAISAVDRVIAQKIRKRIGVTEVVYRNDVHVRVARSKFEKCPPDSPEPVDGDF